MAWLSRIREVDKYQAVIQCIEKEKLGYECVRKLQKTGHYYKNFKRDGVSFEYSDTDQAIYWEAIYEKKVN
ncbi:hypothetical protein [Oceanobacillus sp. CF4.6]|uniref:hypothetical protein n=1 Tax=Oceanobacillus sp. CF4.6 TaxID=3373080 RepID=UPI003EE771CC